MSEERSADIVESKAKPLHHEPDGEILDWDAYSPPPPPRRRGQIQVQLRNKGRGKPLPEPESE